MKKILLSCVLAAAFLSSSRGDEPPSEDKSHYTLFNPTPTDSLRVWRTDRAGVVPYTIDAGHFEVDLNLLTYGFDEQEVLITSSFAFARTRLSTEAWAYGATLIKVGLANSLDAEVAFVPYQTITLEPQTILFSDNGRPVFRRNTRSGFGDVTSRLKLNIWGNDGGKTALSISGNVKFPTASDDLGNGQFEGGPSLEFAAQLPWGFELRIDEFANLFEDNAHARQAYIESLLSLSHQIFGPLEGYFMFNTVAYTTGADWLGEVKLGFNYRLARNIELYTGTYIGVTDRAWDYQPFLGVAARF
jgi:hypothetical protein